MAEEVLWGLKELTKEQACVVLHHPPIRVVAPGPRLRSSNLLPSRQYSFTLAVGISQSISSLFLKGVRDARCSRTTTKCSIHFLDWQHGPICVFFPAFLQEVFDSRVEKTAPQSLDQKLGDIQCRLMTQGIRSVNQGARECCPTIFLGHCLIRNPSRSLWNIKEIANDW
jgi:hypothetical protein